jgi:SAM-dependent methyltransferase
VKSVAAIDDPVIGAAIGTRVRDFYEEHPYPLPLNDLTGYDRTWNDKRRRAEAHLLWPSETYRDDRTILVAGCGTSQAAKYALRWPKAEVIGIDFSATSIEHSARLKGKHGIDNLELRQWPVERANELGRVFDHIACTGVLHHLADPDVGLRALRDVLEPGGALHLMVYAPFGRAGIYLLQDYCRSLGLGRSDGEIRDLSEMLRLLPPDHPIRPLLANAPDFGNSAGLADALLNPQDIAYSVPQLFDLLGACGLEFGRWVRQAAYLPSCGSLVQSPHHTRLKKLPLESQYAALELFRGSMIRHSVVAYRSDEARPDPADFTGEAWLDYVPIRLHDTIVVEERLPPSAAAVLINRSHSYTDIYLPIDLPQKRLFDQIDGGKRISEIAIGSEDRAVARILFERLWQYDQVVFDTTRRNSI